jgi:hypothetical protein
MTVRFGKKRQKNGRTAKKGKKKWAISPFLPFSGWRFLAPKSILQRRRTICVETSVGRTVGW